ncbi:MAG: 3-oxoacyl-[acyl-carrier-protein] reductase [Elusimicrobia bacterium RIFCSPLOWO2_01_FULL_64_13]|nr:MAG: 3-oxoacyl-[acyl-carrier-protein] reductase [Elusimicrobia bacterium RIFCSPHIGHO2_01_FULL_64_10]OGR95028.1 MAG: 3-oxoacyl-[acyl-carrier-protein] reductase [Elusimicrobia bacterium RIFCSPLOWO2_01_FULL_64_13]
MKLKDQVAVVTGGAQGIGKAIAAALAGQGARIAVCDVAEDLAAKTAGELKASFQVDTLALKADVTRPESCEEMAKKVQEAFGRIDILVNNAGITKDNLVMRMSEAEWDAVLDVNLKGAFNCTKAVCRPMMKQRSGRIINICSIVGLMGNAGQANYSASKGGLIALTKTCAREFASRNILVNGIAPGFIKTRMTEQLTDEQKQKLAAIIPLERLGEPEDVAQAALFLAGPDSSYITGQVISVNGGMYM